MDVYGKIDEVILKELSLRIKETRINAKLTQKELSELAGVQRIHISRIEHGNNFNLLTLIKLLRALNKLEDLYKILDVNKDNELRKLFE